MRDVRVEHVVVTLGVGLSLVLHTHAGQEPARQPLFREGVALAAVDVAVRDRRGTLVTDLQQDDVTLCENSTQRQRGHKPGLEAPDLHQEGHGV